MKDLYDKYGITDGYKTKDRPDHLGVDLPTPMRSPLHSPEDGRIAFEGDIPAAKSGWPKDRIIILQLKDSFIVFAHLDETVINTGQSAKQGQFLGYTGNSGYSLGPHLHAEEHQGIKDPNKGFLAYPSIDITPRFTGSAQGGAEDMTIIVRPIAKLKIKLAKPIQMWDFGASPVKALWNSGDYMEVTQKTNIIDGTSFYIPEDRAINGELFGFREGDVFAKGNEIHDTQHDPKPGVDPVMVEKAKKYDQLRELLA